MSNELKPCPFCGGEAKILIHTFHALPLPSNVQVGCTKCGCRTDPWYGTKREAIDAWNTRTGEQDNGNN